MQVLLQKEQEDQPYIPPPIVQEEKKEVQPGLVITPQDNIHIQSQNSILLIDPNLQPQPYQIPEQQNQELIQNENQVLSVQGEIIQYQNKQQVNQMVYQFSDKQTFIAKGPSGWTE